jgi:hypothetical protein
MSTYKSTSGDYTITVAQGYGTFTVNAANVIINGNITEEGNVTTVDPFIVVAANNTGVVQDMGMIAQTGTGTFAGLRFDIPANTWQISPSVTSSGAPIVAYASLASGNAGVPGGSIYDIQINNGSGGFTANNNFQYNPSNAQLTLNGFEVLSNIGTAPTAVANSVAIYNNAPGSGKTGLFVTGNTIPTDEVIATTRAKLYSIIF